MSRLRVLNAEPGGYSPEARAILAEHAEVDERNLDRAGLIASIANYDAVIVRLAHRIDREVLAAAPKLRAVASATTGLDHIDLSEARKRGIAIVSLKGETEFLRSIPATAELTWGLVLALTRQIPAAVAATRRGEWMRDKYIGVDLAGRTLGLVGLGRIGEKVMRYGAAFGMSIAAIDPLRSSWPAGVRRIDSLKALAAVSDVLSVHVPLDPGTENLVNHEVFDAMRSGSYFVNTSRGLVVNEADLLAALASGRLAGAALDVVSGEGRLPFAGSAMDLAQRKYPNMILTPHIGGASHDSMWATEVFIAQKLSAVLKGATPEVVSR